MMLGAFRNALCLPLSERRCGALHAATPRTLWQLKTYDRIEHQFARVSLLPVWHPAQFDTLFLHRQSLATAGISAFIRTRPH
jgi:hypothetical protein